MTGGDQGGGGEEVPCLSQREMRDIQAHVGRYVGTCENVLHERDSQVVHLDLLPVELEFEDVGRTALFVSTMGMSSKLMDFDEIDLEEDEEPPSRLAELCIMLPGGWPYRPGDFDQAGDDAYWPFGWLKMIARMTLDSGSCVLSGECIPNGGTPPAPFTDRCRFVAMLLLPADLLVEGLGRMEAGGKQVDFLMLAPLFADEYEALEASGPEALMELFEAAGLSPLELADPDRTSVCRR